MGRGDGPEFQMVTLESQPVAVWNGSGVHDRNVSGIAFRDIIVRSYSCSSETNYDI